MTEPSSANNGSDTSSHQPHLELLQSTLRKAFKLLVTSGDSSTDLLDMPLGQVRCLRRIIEQDGCKLVDLARETNLSVPNASRLVDRLVRRGLVIRPTDPTDRRAVRLHATAESKAMIASIQDQRLKHMARATRLLSPDQVDMLVASLGVAIEAAEKAQLESAVVSTSEDLPPISRREIVR